MPGVIKRGTDKIIHTGIDNDKIFCRSRFDKQHFGDKRPGMAGNYNSRLLVPEVLVEGGRFAIIRPRPTYDSLLAQDKIPDWL